MGGIADHSIPGLQGSDFIRPPREIRPRIIYEVHGMTKTGKSTFPFWGPPPIAVFDFDRRLEAVVQKAMSGKLTGVPKEIVYIPFKMPVIDVRSKREDKELMASAKSHIDKFLRNFKIALESSRKKGGIRTISVDTETELKDLRLCSEFGRVVGVQPRDLGGVNQDLRDWMRAGEDYDANVVWVNHVKDEWGQYTNKNGEKDSAPTGRKIIDGYNKSEQCVQVVLETSVKGDKFQVKVVSSGLNPATNGKTYTEDDWEEWGPFAYISWKQYPKSDIEEWAGVEE